MNSLTTSNYKNGLEVAVIGLSGRFPGASNVEVFWRNLQNAIESIIRFTDEDLIASGIDRELINDANYVKANGVLDDVDRFDASFFGFSPREAEILDPQHRFILECAWQALENAGYSPEAYNGSIGVYAGARSSLYLLTNLLPNRQEILQSVSQHQVFLSNDLGTLATKISYKLNLEGPSYTVETTCSTSLVAVHLACQSLLSGECDMALAGGVGISPQQKAGYLYEEGGILSPDGHCRAFDANAQGTVGGDGIGLVVLKRLEDALADRDSIRAVIKGSAINNDGALKVSYTAPRIESQAKVISAAQAIAEVDPETISYIEAHGTGTPLGDPIEVAALTQAFRMSTDKKGFCAIGSVKTNIGHLGAAAGVAGLIKTVLALQHKKLPPSLHFQQPNPKIDFANSPFYVNTQLSEWKTNGTPRRAGVSSFGMGGTNAHVILEEAPPVSLSSSSRPYQLIVLSARNPLALETATSNLVIHLKQHPDLNLADVAYTLQMGRRRFDHRRVLVCQDLDEAISALEPVDPQRVFTQFHEPTTRPIIFMFPGQGAQYVGMGRELYATEPVFRSHIDDCCERLQPRLGLDLRQVLYADTEQIEVASQRLKQTALAQSALFVTEYALAQLWMAWGIRPQAMIGHSIGEYVAACLAGVFSLDDALKLVVARGQLMQQLPAGAMLSVSLSKEQVQPWLHQDLSLAVHNAPSLCVVSGTESAIDSLQTQLTQKGIEYRRLHTSHAFHSAMMEPILESFANKVSQIKLHPPEIPFISNVTGTWITADQAIAPHYWTQHLRQTVRFSEGITQLLQESKHLLLEVGPGRTLSTLVRYHLDQAAEHVVLASLRHPQEQQSDVAYLLKTLGKLWLTGASIDWSGFYAHEQRDRIPLPTYPFERQRYWIDPKPETLSDTTSQKILDKQPDIADWFYVPTWKQSLLLPVSSKPNTQAQRLSRWLVFVDSAEIGAAVAEQLVRNEQHVITVGVGQEFSQLHQTAYIINPQCQEDYIKLLQVLDQNNQLPRAVAHFWNITPECAHQEDDQGHQPQTFDSSLFKRNQAIGFYSLLFFVQALGSKNWVEPLQLTVVTSNVHSVTGDEPLSPEQATVLGLCKVIPQEYPNITCYNIDIANANSEASPRLIDDLVTELTTADTDLVVAYRGRHRWVQTFDSIRLNSLNNRSTGLRLRQRGVYLITGGLGRIGLCLAEYLAKAVQPKLVLLGRSKLPEREHWQQWLATHDQEDLISQKIRKILALEHLGAEVLVICADVANEAQMQQAIAQIYDQFKQLHGVIHAAGNVGDTSQRAIQEMTPDDCWQQFMPKVYGLLVLEKVLQGHTLDFCLLLSSLSSILGGLGFGAYAAANLFMDAWAHKHQQIRSFPLVSVNWDGWQFTAESPRTTTSNLATHRWAMTPEEGIAAFEKLFAGLTHRVAQIVISTGDLQARMNQWLKFEPLKQVDSANERMSLSKHSRPNLSNDYVAPNSSVEQIITEIWQDILGIESIGIYDNFFELGGHSLLLTQLISRLRQAFNVEIQIRQIFQKPTIAEQAVIIDQLCKEAQEMHFQPIARVAQNPVQQMLIDPDQISEQELDTLLGNLLSEEDIGQ
jgi:acyl transferase domain-containing protein/acyl carrier protein